MKNEEYEGGGMPYSASAPDEGDEVTAHRKKDEDHVEVDWKGWTSRKCQSFLVGWERGGGRREGGREGKREGEEEKEGRERGKEGTRE